MFVCIKNCGFSKGDIVELKSTVNNYNILMNIKTKEQNVFTKGEMDKYFIDKESYDKLNNEIENYLYGMNNKITFENGNVVESIVVDENFKGGWSIRCNSGSEKAIYGKYEMDEEYEENLESYQQFSYFQEELIMFNSIIYMYDSKEYIRKELINSIFVTKIFKNLQHALIIENEESICKILEDIKEKCNILNLKIGDINKLK